MMILLTGATSNVGSSLCEQYLRASGSSFSILRPNSFMQNLLLFAPSIRTERAFRAPAEGVVVSMIDAREWRRPPQWS